MRGSISRLKLFKACRRAYYFKYVEGLQPVEKATALELGTNYHELIETLYKDGDLYGCEENNSKELAMACAYWKYIYPKFKVKAVEEWQSKPLGDHTMVGRVDGIAEDGALVEHKTTSLDIGDEYEFNLQWDEQMLVYMWLTGTTHIWYTVCEKPTIRQKKTETDEDFFNRMVEWYDEDTDSKIRVLKLTRAQEEIDSCMQELLATMNDAESLDGKPQECFYKNTCYCNNWGRRCEYSSICLNYNPNQQYVEFTKG